VGTKKYKAPPFVMLRKDLLKAPEWRKLSFSAMVVYIYLRSKFNHKTLGQVSLAYSEMKDMMSTKTMSRALKELQAAGFIEKTKQGGLFGGVCEYRFIGPYKDFYYQGFKV